ncbi:hypothetical protein ACHAXR_005512 [Thalassiosira sp. AJA248-18]
MNVISGPSHHIVHLRETEAKQKMEARRGTAHYPGARSESDALGSMTKGALEVLCCLLNVRQQQMKMRSLHNKNRNQLKMFLPRVWLLLQTLSLCTDAFATSRPITAVTSDPTRARYRRQQACLYRTSNKRSRMCRAFDPQQNNNCHHHGGPLLAFHPQQQRGQYYPSSYQTSQDRQQQHTQPRYSNGRLPLAMIPDSQRHTEGKTSSSRRPTTSLDDTKRGGGGTGGRRGDGKTISVPTTSTTTTSDDSSSSIASQLSAIAQPLTSKLSSITKTISTSKTAQGRAILLLVAFLYGTLNVTLRAIYATEGPPVASVLSLVRQCLSIVTFIPIFIAARNAKKGQDEEENGQYWEGLEEQRIMSADGEVVEKVRPMWMSALELAFWNLGAQGFINAGLLSSPAARAAFLTQTSVVMTPLISALAGERVKSSVWGGCGLALFGLFLISTSASPADIDGLDSATGMFNEGDVLILLGALSWSAYIFRTSKLAKSYPELDLQFAKTTLLAVMYGGWFISTAASTLASAGTSFLSAGWVEALTPLWSGWNSPVVWLLLAYSAVGPGAVADLLQQQGQKETSASESNIILCMESVFAAVCAFALLGEVSSMKEIAGGMLIVVAAILASK